MKTETWIREYWQSVAQKDANAILSCFAQDAVIRWHNTNEQFTAKEFARANAAYPGSWQSEIEQLILTGSVAVTAVRVFGDVGSFHATSFFTLKNGLIAYLDEYWGDDGPPPAWRLDAKIGKPIR